MPWIPEELRCADTEIRSGGQPFKLSVRTLLSWFRSERRGTVIVGMIRDALDDLGLETAPDFELVYLDRTIELRGRKIVESIPVPTIPSPGVDSSADMDAPDDEVAQAAKYADPVPRVGMLGAANRPPQTTTRDAQVHVAITMMLMNDFSQLPVMQGQRNVQGMISWKSIGRARALGQDPEYVRDCMDERVAILDYDTPLFEAVALITSNEVALVRDLEGKISGLVTTSDISLQFHALSEPFLQIGEIENHIRRLLIGRFTVQELAAVRDPSDSKRTVEGIASLSFGEYVRLLERPEYFKRLGYKLSRDGFVGRLQEIKRIRNDVMHFHPDGITPADLSLLRDTVRFMQRL